MEITENAGESVAGEEPVKVEVEPGTGVHSYKNKLKKRKKKFITNAKGFGKIGNFGRGTRLEGDEFTYFINILDAIRLGFDSLDDKREYHKVSSQIVDLFFFIFFSVNGVQRF